MGPAVHTVCRAQSTLQGQLAASGTERWWLGDMDVRQAWAHQLQEHTLPAVLQEGCSVEGCPWGDFVGALSSIVKTKQ